MPHRVYEGQFVLTDQEFAALQSIVESGDRAGFYMTYAAMIAETDRDGAQQVQMAAV